MEEIESITRLYRKTSQRQLLRWTTQSRSLISAQTEVEREQCEGISDKRIVILAKITTQFCIVPDVYRFRYVVDL